MPIDAFISQPSSLAPGARSAHLYLSAGMVFGMARAASMASTLNGQHVGQSANFCHGDAQPMGLKLEELRLRNFKSFLGQHAISGLDSHLTAIVGPNGSGKSNVIDSILFVLGYRARKMRHAVLRDLITKGCSECEVELIFNEFRLSRTLCLSGGQEGGAAPAKTCTSKYYLNGEETGCTAAQDFLRSRGIDLDNNRFLILQGEIENIALMAPLELLDYIEDCIGTSSYKAQISGAEKEVQDNDEAAATAGNKLRFVEADYLYKKGRRDEKICHLSCRSGALALKHKIVAMKAEGGRRRQRGLLLSKDQVAQALAELQNKNSQKLREIKELERRRDGLDIQRRDDALLQARAQAQVAAREGKAREAKSNALKKEVRRLEDEIRESAAKAESWAHESAACQEQLARYSDEIRALSLENGKRMKTLGSHGEVRANEARKRSYEQELVSLLKRREHFTRTETEIQQLRSRLSKLEGRAPGGAGASAEQIGACEGELRQLQGDLRATYCEIQKRRRCAEDFKFVEEAYRREKTVSEALDGVRGVHGQLRGLGVIERGYEAAVESAAKGLGSIVVGTTSVAEECISIINRRGLSRTTFIILDKLPDAVPVDGNAHWRGRRSASDSLLHRRISCDEQYVKAFYFALKDTLVVDTLEEAKGLAFGPVRRRVVTVDGKLLEKSGVMSGGKVAKKLKGVSELEDIHANISRLVEQKKGEVEAYKSYWLEKEAYDRDRRRATELEAELGRQEANFDQEQLGRIDEEIVKIKGLISGCLSDGLPAGLRLLQGDAVLCNEKIGCLEKMCQELRVRLSCAPQQNVEERRAALQQLQRELSELPPIRCDTADLAALESEYQSHLSVLKEVQQSIAALRSEMGRDYHEEAECRSRLEEINDSLAECEKIAGNCAAKDRVVCEEYRVVQGLLARHGEPAEERRDGAPQPCIGDPSLAEMLADMTDAELKARIRELAEELSTKEAEDHKKLKALYKSTDEAGVGEILNDAHVYEAIFSEYEGARRSYEQTKESHAFLQSKAGTLREGLASLHSERHSRFMEGFALINRNLKEIFLLITFGGSAELDLLDYLNPFSEGIVLSIMPPKKAWKQVSNLSGGEKTLASLSLIFALHRFRPSAFYVMDEIDAALDYKNVSVIAQYIERISSQFIIISLRDSMFEKASTLLGVYKTHNASRAVLVNVDKLAL